MRKYQTIKGTRVKERIGNEKHFPFHQWLSIIGIGEMVLKYCTLAQVFLVFELDKDSAKMQRCGEGCHNCFGENAGNLLSPELCLCVWRGTKEAGYKKKSDLSKFVAQQRGHFSISWELKSIELFILFLDSLCPMSCLGLMTAPLKYPHTSLFHSFALFPGASTLDHSYSLLLSVPPSQTAEGYRTSHNLESCAVTNSSTTESSETPSVP